MNLVSRNIAREKPNGISHSSETVDERFASDTEKSGGIVSLSLKRQIRDVIHGMSPDFMRILLVIFYHNNLSLLQKRLNDAVTSDKSNL